MNVKLYRRPDALMAFNFQVDHHLFPGISHVHYPQINKIVKETCKDLTLLTRNTGPWRKLFSRTWSISAGSAGQPLKASSYSCKIFEMVTFMNK